MEVAHRYRFLGRRPSVLFLFCDVHLNNATQIINISLNFRKYNGSSAVFPCSMVPSCIARRNSVFIYLSAEVVSGRAHPRMPARNDVAEEGNGEAQSKQSLGNARNVARRYKTLDRTGDQEYRHDADDDLNRASALQPQLDAPAIASGKEHGLGHEQPGAAADPDGGQLERSVSDDEFRQRQEHSRRRQAAAMAPSITPLKTSSQTVPMPKVRPSPQVKSETLILLTAISLLAAGATSA